MLILSFV